jgi:membrane carboxypeptidase/penicillin-binding protein PbpC
MDPRTGEILALVGSADFDNVEIDGQVNMALAPRQPGSTIKPLVYLAAFEQPERPVAERWTPETMVADIKEEFPDGVNPPYVPTNYDGKEHGIMTVRSALGNSYNIPAVRAMQAVGIPKFISLAERLGVTTLTRADYGLSLALGAGEIPLIEMTGAFGVLADGGVLRPPVAIARIVDGQGNIVCDQESDRPCTADPRAGQQVISAVDAFLLTDILSDNEARTPAFGENSMLRLSRPVAAKTGTTNDIRDILTLGYTPQLVTGVWVGNADNSPMVNVSGVSGAAPIWNQFMSLALADQPVEEFTPPPGVLQFEVCADTGTLPSPACPAKRMRWFAEDRPPLPADKDLWQTVRVDKNTGRLANEFTPPDAIEERAVKVYPERYRAWAEANGLPQPPVQQPTDPANQPQLAIRVPFEGETVGGVVPVYGTVNVPNLVSFELQYGESHDPQAFSAPFSGPHGGQVIEGPLGQWDTTGLREGPHTLRLVARDANGGVYETRVRLFVGQQSPPVVEPTVEPTPVPPATEVAPPPTPEVIVLPTDTPVFEPPTVTPTTVVEQPTSAPIEEPALTPTWTPEGGAPITDTVIITGAGEFAPPPPPGQ